MVAPLAVTRLDVANFVSALVTVYSILIFAWVIVSLVFALGAHVPYSRWSNAILNFLRDVCEPYLQIFRRFIPPIGPLDITPIVALIVLQIVGAIVVRLIEG